MRNYEARICWISSSELSVNLERQNGWLIHEPDSSTTCMPIRNSPAGIFLINPRAFPVSPSRAPTSHKVCDFICRAFCLDKCHSNRANGRLWRVKLRVRGPQLFPIVTRDRIDIDHRAAAAPAIA